MSGTRLPNEFSLNSVDRLFSLPSTKEEVSMLSLWTILAENTGEYALFSGAACIKPRL
jgi:hypothetical protein